MNELNWLVVVRTKASKFEPEYKNVVAAFNSLVLAEDFIKKEIKAELERWKKEVDFDNPRILEVEAFFISVLTHCEN